MSQKLYLIDEQKYDALMKNYDSTHVNIAKADMANILENPDLNVSSKNALYNNILRQFIKKMKGAAEKPVNVNVSNDSIPFKNDDLNNTIKQLDTTLQQFQNINTTPQPQKKPKKSPVKPIPSNTFTPLTNLQNDVDEIITTPKTTTTFNILKTPKPKTTNKQLSAINPRETRKRNANTKQNINDQIIGLTNHLMENREQFNLNSKGEIMDKSTGKAVPGSSHVDIAEYAIKGSTGGAATPPGYNKINKLLHDDKEVRRFTVKNWAK